MNWNRFFKWGGLLLLIGIASLVVIYFILDNWQEPIRMDDEARREAAGEFISLSKGKTHYITAGPEDGKQIVLIHGGMVSGMFAWNKNFDFLVNQGYRVLMYDLYGRGYSDRVQEEYTPQLLFNQFEELMDSLQLRKPISIAGLSLGTMVAIDYTRRYPENVERLMLISPVARGKVKTNPVLKIPLLSDLLMAVYWFPRTVNNQMNELYQPEKHPEYEQKLREMIRYKGYKESNYSTWINTLSYNMESEIEEVGGHNIPVALVLGEHDPYVSENEAEVYQGLLPALKVHIIKEAGHVVNFEKPAAVNNIMNRFFNSDLEKN